MRAHELLEIYKIAQRDVAASKKDINAIIRYADIASGVKSLPGGTGLVYRVKRQSEEIVIAIADPVKQEVVGYLELLRTPHFPMKNAHMVTMIAVDPERRGQGIARALYGIYLSMLKYPLLAGSDQSPGGRRNWLSLAQIPGTEVRGYVNIRDEWFDKTPEFDADTNAKKFNQFLDNVMSMGGDYLGKKRDVHFFAFDVVPGSGELEPAVKNQLKLYGYNPFTNPGLYAVWGGE
jgi:GNAT superfamily N-acetyltransferase